MERHFWVVDNDEMLLLNNNLNLLTGIYKKSHVPENNYNNNKINNNNKNIKPLKDLNVVLTTSPQGKIMPTDLFNENYRQFICNNYKILNEVSGQQSTEATNDKTPNTNDEVLNNWNKFIKLNDELQTTSNRNVIFIEKNNCEICCIDPIENQQTIYRFLSDVELGIAAPGTVALLKLNQNPSANAKATKQDEIIKKRKNIVPVDNKFEMPYSYQRTRSGRCVRRQAMQHNGTANELANDNDTVRNLINEIKDNDYRCYLKKMETVASNDNHENHNDEKEKEEEEEENAIKHKKERHVPPEAICPKCKKIFLGRRLKKHFAEHPDHIMLSNNEAKSSENPTLFNYLISKLQKTELNEDQRAELFLNEINDLVEQLRLRSSRLIRNTTGLHSVTALTACVIGIPEGQYALDMSAILAAPELPLDIEENAINKNVEVYATNSLNEHNCLDYTALSMSLDVNITDEVAQKLNLSAGGKLLPPSEESLLRNVEDLVPERLNKNSNKEAIKLSNSSNVQHYEQANDNAVEAVTMKVTNNRDNSAPILELPIDFFSI